MMRQDLTPNFKLGNYAVLVCEVVVLSRCLHTCQLSRAEHNVEQACPKNFITVILIFTLRLYDEVNDLHAKSKYQANTYILYRHVSDKYFHPFPTARY